MNKELFKNYADIKNQIKDLTAKAKEIEKFVSGEMVKEDVEEVKSDFGTFYFTTRKTWEYSKDIKILEEGMKKNKEMEQENGTAKFEEKKSLTFRSK